MSCTSLHLGKNYGAVCVTGSVNACKNWMGGGCPTDSHKRKWAGLHGGQGRA